MTELTTTHDYDLLASHDLSIVFKHSTTCPISLYAHREVARFCERRPDAEVYLISVRQRRDLARHVTQKTGVEHESPQVLVLRRGDVLASASHSEVTADWIAWAISSNNAA